MNFFFTYFGKNFKSYLFKQNSGDGEAVGTAVVATLIACGTGGLVVLFIWKLLPQGRVWSLAKFINGCLAGMVTVCAGCNEFYPWIACLVSSIGGFVYLLVSDLMVRMRIDDPLDAVAVHGGPGKFCFSKFLSNLIHAPLKKFQDYGV